MTRQEILQIAKPILFNTPMVGALLNNRKTATRRVVKKKFVDDVLSSPARLGNPDIADQKFITCLCNAPYEAGDYLYVRETWGSYKVCGGISYAFKADYIGYAEDENKAQRLCHGWRPSIHMPKEAARLFLRVTDVRVERLQDITEQQAQAEGIEEHLLEESAYKLNGGKKIYKYADGSGTTYYPTKAFSELWNSTVKKSDLDRYGWNANPWIWVTEFEEVEIDA